MSPRDPVHSSPKAITLPRQVSSLGRGVPGMGQWAETLAPEREGERGESAREGAPETRREPPEGLPRQSCT